MHYLDGWLEATARVDLAGTAIHGGQSNEFGITIDASGLKISGDTDFTIDQEANYGIFKLANIKGNIKIEDGVNLLYLESTLSLEHPDYGELYRGQAWLEFNQQGLHNGGIKASDSACITEGLNDFKIDIGLTLKAEKFCLGIFDSKPGLSVTAALEIPKEWSDGADVASKADIIIDKDGRLYTTGAEFTFALNAAGAKLTGLSGAIHERGAGYEIRASGVFQLADTESGGGCSLGVRVTLYTDQVGGRMLEMTADQKAPTKAIQALQLEHIGVTYAPCAPGIAIGTTGFFLTEMSGDIYLDASGVDRAVVGLRVESALKVGNIAAIAAEATGTISTKPDLSLLLEGIVYALGTETASTEILMSKQDGFWVKHLSFNVGGFDATFTLHVWEKEDTDKVLATGTGKARIKFEKGFFAPLIPWKDWRSPRINSDFGSFTNGRFGFKLYVKYKGYGTGVYVDHKGKIAFGNVDKYVLESSRQIHQARQTWQAAQKGESSQAKGALDERFTFQADGTTFLRVPVPGLSPAQARVASQDVLVASQSDVIFALDYEKATSLDLSLIKPDGQEITSGNLPANVYYEHNEAETIAQAMYIVEQAMPGDWQMKLSGDTATAVYTLTVLGNVPPPILTELDLTATGKPNQVEVSWRLLAREPDTIINIYAHQGSDPTAFIPNEGDLSQTDVISSYTNIRLAEDLASATDGSLQKHILDMDISSGDYTIWIEADDDRSKPVRHYIAFNNKKTEKGVVQSNSFTKVTVDHQATFPQNWLTLITPTVDLKNRKLFLAWQNNSHPDVDGYTIRVRVTDINSPELERISETAVGLGRGSAVGRSWIWGIEPGKTYHIAIGAEDADTNRIAWSQEESITTNQPGFALSTALTDITINPGDQEIAIPLTLNLDPDLPYPVVLEPDYSRQSVAVSLTFDQPIVEETPSTPVYAYISVVETIPPGQYIVPVLARSNDVKRALDINLTVSAETNQENYLPIIVR